MSHSTWRRILSSRWLLLVLLFLSSCLRATTSVYDDEDAPSSAPFDARREEGNRDAVRASMPTSGEVVPEEIARSETVFRRALHKAIGGGVPGAVAGAVQVLSLMWLVSVRLFVRRSKDGLIVRRPRFWLMPCWIRFRKSLWPSSKQSSVLFLRDVRCSAIVSIESRSSFRRPLAFVPVWP